MTVQIPLSETVSALETLKERKIVHSPGKAEVNLEKRLKQLLS